MNTESTQEKQILVIDDNPMIVKIIEHILDNAGYQSLVPPDDCNILEYINENKELVDIVLLDLIMPKVDGFDILKHLKDEKIQILPIVVSKYADPATKLTAQNLGAFDFIEKPINNSLIKSIKKAIKYKKEVSDYFIAKKINPISNIDEENWIFSLEDFSKTHKANCPEDSIAQLQSLSQQINQYSSEINILFKNNSSEYLIEKLKSLKQLCEKNYSRALEETCKALINDMSIDYHFLLSSDFDYFNKQSQVLNNKIRNHIGSLKKLI